MNAELKQLSIFSLSGLGQAPFKVVGIAEAPSRALLEANPHAYNLALALLPKGYGCGTCALCGTAISVNYLVNSACGLKHAIGCECISKIGCTKLTSEAHELKLKRERDRRSVKRHAEREARLNAERNINGGETNYEQEQRIAEEIRITKDAMIQAALQPILKSIESYLLMLDASNSDFGQRVASGIRRGNFPYGSGPAISCEIAAKQLTGKRSNAKVFKDAYASFLHQLEKAETEFKASVKNMGDDYKEK